MESRDWAMLIIFVLVLAYLVYRTEIDRRRLTRDVAYIAPPKPEEQTETEALTQALEVDMSNPPRTRVYEPKGVGGARCSCHNRELRRGEEILWWPQTDGSVLVICKESKAS